MQKRFSRSILMAALLALTALPAWAQNTTTGTAVQILVGQAPIRITLPTGSADRFYSTSVVADRSYCAEATASDTELNDADPKLTLLHTDGVTPFGTDSSTSEPKGTRAARVCFIATATETVYIKVSPESASFENREYTMRFLETTLWANVYYIGPGFVSYSLLRNTTNGSITYDVRWRDASGAVISSGTAPKVGQTLAANGVGFFEAGGTFGCGGGCTAGVQLGSVEVSHNGSPEAVIGSQTTFSGATGISFDTLFFQRRTW